MLTGYHRPLDSSLPVVAAQAFTSGDCSFRPGDPVDWRSLGATEYDLAVWAKYGFIENAREPSDAELEQLTAPAPAPREATPRGKRR